MTRRAPMAPLTRRQALRMMAAGAGLVVSPAAVQRAAAAVQEAAGEGAAVELAFFTAHEFETARLLADIILPADERSGSASDAGVAEFMDFILSEYEDDGGPIRGGLAWLDFEAQDRFGVRFVACASAQQEAILDDIAWPDRAPAGMSHGVAFFNRFRDLTATGFWSSKMGIEDLGYQGNRFEQRWNGCPDEQLRRLGLLE